MATRKFTSNAPYVKMIRTYTPANVGVGNTFTLTCNSKTVTFTATATTVANVTAGIVALLNSTTAPPPAEFQEVTWTDETTHVQGVSKTSGKPFTITSSASGGTATFTAVTTTANSGPNDISLTANWSAATLPITGDTVVLENSSVDILYGLDFSGATGVTLLVKPTYSGSIGLPERTATGYTEYRGTYWQMGCTSVVFEGTSPRAKFDIGTNPGAPVSFKVFNTGSSSEAGVPAMLIKGGHATNHIDLQSYKGSIGVAFFASETCHIGTPTITYLTNQSSDSRVTFGSGVTFNDGEVHALAGQVEVNSNSAEMVCGPAATLTVKLSSAMSTSLTNQGGTVIYQSSGTCAIYYGFGGSVLDVRTPFTLTNAGLYSGSTLRDPLGLVTYTNPLMLLGCSINDVTLETQPNVTVEIVDI